MVYKNVLLLSLFVFLTGALRAVNNPNVQSPVGSPTAVPSTARPGLIPNRPFDVTGSQDVITGQVGGLQHFRGILPYRSSRSIGTTAYSPVDDFLRRSYDPIASDRSPGTTRPYYDPRRTVTTFFRADGADLFSPTITTQGQTDPYIPPMLAQTLDTQYRQRPLSLSGSELERLMSRQMQLRDETDAATPQDEKEKDPAVIEDIRSESFFETYLRTEELRPVREPKEPKDPQDTSAERPDEDKPELLPEERVREEFQEAYRQELLEDGSERTSELLRSLQEGTPEDSELTPEQAALQAADNEHAAAMLRRYGDYERLANARTADYIAAAEVFLKEGRFYKAADAFALAAIWGPEDVRPFVGQAVSLFAAGEYMSSSYLLRQAIMKNANVASAAIDISTLIRNRDVFENRLIEMATWQQRNKSGELAFLIAYIMHHDGQAHRATEAINNAVETMPDDPAVRILRSVILPDAAR